MIFLLFQDRSERLHSSFIDNMSIMSDFLSSSGDTTLNLLKNDLIDYSSTSSSISKSSLFKIDLVDISKKADLIPGKEVKLRGKFI